MNVRDLQATLHDLCRLLESAGAAKSRTEPLAAFAAGLDRFGDQSLKTFSDLLGRIGTDGSPVPGSSNRGRAMKTAPDPSSLTGEAKTLFDLTKCLFDNAASPNTTDDQVTTLGTRLTPLKGDELKAIAKGIGLQFTSKESTKEKMAGAITRYIKGRMGGTVRSQLTSRTAETNGTAQ